MDRPHTPFKSAAPYSFSDGRVLASTQQQMVIDEVDGCVFQDPAFVDTIFPLALIANGEEAARERIRKFMEELENRGLLEPIQYDWPRWKELVSLTKESDMLTPLVKILNAITELCGSAGSIQWRDEHDKPPRSACHEKLRPDILAMLKHFSPVHWHNVLLPIEIKRRNRPEQALPQLITYARNVLREQWDRRFTFGLIFAGKMFEVWLFDRSGAVGSPAFDFHKVRMNVVAVSTWLTQVSWPTGH